MVRENRPVATRMLRAFWAVMVIGLCSRGDALAQWEHIYGGPCVETGYGGVAPVVACGGGGYISVGRSSTPNVNATTPCPAASFDTYVVRTNAGGGVIWANTYNISGGTGNDVAYSVVELPAGGGVNGMGGFVVVGTTDEPAGTSTDAYLMEIDCNGAVIWVSTYGVGGTVEEGRDVVRTAFGNNLPPQFSTPNDYVVAGWSFSGGGQDALLFRTGMAGALKWNMVYNGGAIDYLMALDETVVPLGGGVGPGDIVAAGGTTSFGNALQGLAMRVNGNNGTIGMAPQGIGDHGGPANEAFNSVQELAAPGPFRNNLVFAGFTTVNAPTDIYVVRTPPSPCAMIAQVVINGANPGDVDIAYDITESQNNHGCGPIGSLALTGATNNGAAGLEAFLLTLNTGPLGVICAFTYGDRIAPGMGAGNEGGNSIEDDPGGYIICGYSQSNLNFAAPPDPEDMYLVRPNGAGATGMPGCQLNWAPFPVVPAWMPGCWAMPNTSPIVGVFWPRAAVGLTGDVAVCPRLPCIIRLPDNRGNGSDGGSRTSGAGIFGDDGSAIRAYPNPVRKGSDMTIEFLPKATGGDITVRVMNVLGQLVDVVVSENTGGIAGFALKSDDIPAGTYIIEISDGTRTQTTRVVVTD